MTVMRTTEEEMLCLMTCDFVPEPQLRRARKYIFVNEWNRDQIFQPHLHVGNNGSIVLERGFAINMQWSWGIVYDQFSSEIEKFLESIDVMQSQLRLEEDAASTRQQGT